MGAITELSDQLDNLILDQATAIIFDTFGNFVHRFEQEDGCMALPVLIQGAHHLPGRVGVCEDSVFKTLVSGLIPVFGSKNGPPVVIMPPIPRYMLGGCCNDNSHCKNVTKPDHAKKC